MPSLSAREIDLRVSSAIDSTLNGGFKSFRQGAITYKAPISTVYHRVKACLNHSDTHESQQYLTPSEEDALTSYVLHMNCLHQPLTVGCLWELATVILRRQVPGYQGTLGYHWSTIFWQRNPDIKISLSHALDYARQEFEEDDELASTGFFLSTCTILTRLDRHCPRFWAKWCW